MLTTQTILFGISAICFLAFVALVAAYWRHERRERTRLQQTRTDIADIAILFQTMRDILGQQKAMARAFNDDMEKKMALVKQVLAQGVERNQRLYDRQKQLESRLDEAAAVIESLQRQILHLRSNTEQARSWPAGLPTATARAAAPPREEPPELPQAPVHTGPAVIKRDEAEAALWTPIELDLSPAPPAPEPEEAPIPITPEDATAAREAFRTLLNFNATPAETNDASIDVHAGLTSKAPSGAAVPAGKNGGGTLALRARVLEYSQAGMQVPDIARELGIGKGEVRLLLSLAKQSAAR